MNITWDHIYLAIQIVVSFQLLAGIILNLIEFRARNLLLAYLSLLVIYTYNIFFLGTESFYDHIRTPLHLLLSYIYFGPTFYLYLKSLKKDTSFALITTLKHYSIPLLFCIFYNVFAYQIYGLVVDTFIIVYFVASLPLYKQITSTLKGNLKRRFNWFFIISCVYICLDTPLILIEDLYRLGISPFTDIHPVLNEFFYTYIHFPLLLLYFSFLSIYMLTEIPRFKNFFVSRPLIESGITQKGISELQHSFDKSLTEEKVYLDPDLNLDTFSKKLGIDKSVLSKFIKETYNSGFNRIINRHRIEQFKTLLNEDKLKNYDLVGLAKESGFKSKATFYRVFKEIEGITPLQYKNKYEKLTKKTTSNN